MVTVAVGIEWTERVEYVWPGVISQLNLFLTFNQKRVFLCIKSKIVLKFKFKSW